MIFFKDNEAQTVISNYTVTGSWVNIGDPIDVRDVSSIAVWLKLDINDAQNVRIRGKAMATSNATDLYDLPIINPSSTVTKVQPDYIEIDSDADQNIVFTIKTIDTCNYVQLQAQAGTAGASPAILTSVMITATR